MRCYVMNNYAPIIFALVFCSLASSQERGISGSVLFPPPSGGRVALVIGNGAYKSGPLRNPANDANDMARALKDCGFDVMVKTDCSFEQMGTAVTEFGSRLRGVETALFFYAGHGIQSQGENYLVPVDAEIDSEQMVRYRCLNAGEVLAEMETAGSRVNIVILDACRNNPFGRSFRSMNHGLANMTAAKGTILSYATAPGKVAADGTGRNGVYTGCLLKYLQTPGLEIRDLFMRVRVDVAKLTGDAQIPWENSSLMGEFRLVPGESDASTVSPAPGPVAVLQPAPSAPLPGGGLQDDVNAESARVSVDRAAWEGDAVPDKSISVGPLFPPTADIEYKRYWNSRFGYEIDYPTSFLIAMQEADNGDGRHFVSSDENIRLSCWGSLELDRSMDDEYARVLQEMGSGCTYKARKANWFVVSGIKDGNVWYKRTVDLGEEFISFEFSYPRELLEYMNPVVTHISKSFKKPDK